MDFIFNSYETEFDSKVLDLPTVCDPNNKCTFLSACGAVRGNEDIKSEVE